MNNRIKPQHPVDQQSFFENLPSEIILHILKNIEENEVENNIKKVSKIFYDLVHEFYLNSIYGQSLRFNRWQEENIEKFRQSVNQFKTM